MRKSKFTDQQIAFALQQAETGTPVSEVVRKMGSASRHFIDGRRSTPVSAPVKSADFANLKERTADLLDIATPAEIAVSRTLLTMDARRLMKKAEDDGQYGGAALKSMLARGGRFFSARPHECLLCNRLTRFCKTYENNLADISKVV